MFVHSLSLEGNCLNYNKFMSDEFILFYPLIIVFLSFPLRNAFAFSAAQD